MVNREWGQMGQNYLRSLFALGFQAFLIMVCVGIYPVLVQDISVEDDVSTAQMCIRDRRDTSHLAMKGASIAMPLRGQEMNRLLEGIGEILLEAVRERAARDQQDKVLEMMAQIFPFDEESGAV